MSEPIPNTVSPESLTDHHRMMGDTVALPYEVSQELDLINEGRVLDFAGNSKKRVDTGLIAELYVPPKDEEAARQFTLVVGVFDNQPDKYEFFLSEVVPGEKRPKIVGHVTEGGLLDPKTGEVINQELSKLPFILGVSKGGEGQASLNITPTQGQEGRMILTKRSDRPGYSDGVNSLILPGLTWAPESTELRQIYDRPKATRKELGASALGAIAHEETHNSSTDLSRRNPRGVIEGYKWPAAEPTENKPVDAPLSPDEMRANMIATITMGLSEEDKDGLHRYAIATGDMRWAQDAGNSEGSTSAQRVRGQAYMGLSQGAKEIAERYARLVNGK